MSFPSFSAGDVLTAADMNAVGLWLIKTDTITSGSSKEITGIFSSTYRNYLILVDNFDTSAASILRMRMGTNNSNYYSGGVVVNYSTAAVSGEGLSNFTEWTVGPVGDGTGKAAGRIEVFNPFQTVRTSFVAGGSDSRTNGGGTRQYSGFHNNTSSFTSCTFLLLNANFVSCNIQVYGYRN